MAENKIPEAAVEAAARVMYAQDSTQQDMGDFSLEVYEHDARAILEAAAPFVAAQALEEAASDFEDNIGVGEFDELARRDGARWTHINDAWEYQGPYMDWLRARAVTLRGEA